MSFLDLPEYLVSSEMSICKGSYCDNIPERMINVDIQVINNNMIPLLKQSIKKKNMKFLRKKYIYSSETLEKKRWPKLKICGSFFIESPSNKKANRTQNNQENIILETSLTQSLQKLPKDEQKIAESQSLRTLRPPCFTPYVSTNRNLVIPTSDTPIQELPHPFQSKTMKVIPNYKTKIFDMNDPFIRFNSDFLPSTIISSYQYNNNTQKKQMQTSLSKTTEKAGKREAGIKTRMQTSLFQTTEKALDEQRSANTQIDTPFYSNDDYNLNSMKKSIQTEKSVPLIFRTEMRKKKNDSSLKGRPYFTTCQEPLVKRPTTLNELNNNTSYII